MIDKGRNNWKRGQFPKTLGINSFFFRQRSSLGDVVAYRDMNFIVSV